MMFVRPLAYCFEYILVLLLWGYLSLYSNTIWIYVSFMLQCFAYYLASLEGFTQITQITQIMF